MNLENLGVQEMSAQEVKNVEGGKIPVVDNILECFYEFGRGLKDGIRAAL